MTTETPDSTALTYKGGLPITAGHSQLDYVLLDGSGSMMSKWFNMLGAIDVFMDDVKRAGIASRVKLATFDNNDIHCLQRDVEIADWKPLQKDPIGSHWGETPLYDALEQLGLELRELNPDRACILIATDGGENGSRSCDIDRARAIIHWMQAKGWQVTFIGINWNNSRLANSLGLQPSQAIGVAREHLTSAASELAKKRAIYGHTGSPIHWSEEDRKNFGGYLA